MDAKWPLSPRRSKTHTIIIIIVFYKQWQLISVYIFGMPTIKLSMFLDRKLVSYWQPFLLKLCHFIKMQTANRSHYLVLVLRLSQFPDFHPCYPGWCQWQNELKEESRKGILSSGGNCIRRLPLLFVYSVFPCVMIVCPVPCACSVYAVLFVYSARTN